MCRSDGVGDDQEGSCDQITPVSLDDHDTSILVNGCLDICSEEHLYLLDISFDAGSLTRQEKFLDSPKVPVSALEENHGLLVLQG